MKDQLPTGAYVIRNKETSTVLHIKDLDLTNDSCKVVIFEQDENCYRHQQLWWIEPFPGSENEDRTEGEWLYSITSVSSGLSLDFNPKMEKGTKKGMTKESDYIIASRCGEAPWNKWRIERVDRGKDEQYYKIISVWSNHCLWGRNTRDVTFQPCAPQASDGECWEFVVPAVAFPPGWFRIQNAETGDILSHTYQCNPPVLIKPSTHALASQHRETWGAQWSITQAKICSPKFKSTKGGNVWCIKNRLTGGLLGNLYNTKHPFEDTRKVSGYFWNFSSEEIAQHFWKLEIDPACNSRWKIIHDATGSLLERTTNQHYGGTEVACIDKKFPQGSKDKAWFLTPPAIQDTEEDTCTCAANCRHHRNTKAQIDKAAPNPSEYNSEPQ